MKKQAVKICAVTVAAMMTMSPLFCVQAAEGMEGTEAVREAVQEQETVIEAGERIDTADDGRATTYGLSDGVYVVVARTAKVRSGPGTNYSVCGTLKQKAKIKGKLLSKGWVKTKYEDKTAYVSMSCLKKVNK